MPVVLDDTLSGEYSNSYTTQAFADDYWANHFATAKGTQWSALGSDQKDQLLVLATRSIESARFVNRIRSLDDAQLVYSRLTGTVLQFYDRRQAPTPYLLTQALQFPRNIDVDSTTGATYIPEPILMAQAEQALYILNFDESNMLAQLQGMQSQSIGLLRGMITETQTFSTSGAAAGSTVGPMALELIRPFLLKGSAKLRRS